ncbi:MAG TPA: sugar phosphate isomerase/epimerase family protein [Devosiaceae bacterium]|jgi:sugar phosphate isomerase/epimerase
MQHELPVVGAAMMVADLERNHNWLLESQRDLELQDFIFPEVLEGDMQPLVAEARRWLGGYTGRLGIHGAFFNLPLDVSDPLVRDVVKRRLWQGLDACEALGASHMVVHSPFTAWTYNNLAKDEGAREQLIANCHLSMDDAARRAEGMGCTIVIENIEDRNPNDRVELAKSFNSTAVAVSIDTGHAHYAHGTTGAPPVDYYVLAAGTHLAHIHLQDADGYADRHWSPGMGTIHWHAVFAALRKTGADPRLILELNDTSKIQEAASWLAAQGLVR